MKHAKHRKRAVQIGVKRTKHRKRAVQIGEKIGLYGDWPKQKGCVSPYVPVWVEDHREDKQKKARQTR